jgi:Protein of unknown function (DUF2934)/Pentapeptide repeats (8 copies)
MPHAPLKKTALRRLSLFGNQVKGRAAAIWEAPRPRLKRARGGLEPTAKLTWQWLKLRPWVWFAVAGSGSVVLLLVFGNVWHWYSLEHTDHNGVIHHPHADILNPIGAAIAGAIIAWAALRQADTASRRHKEQTDADRQRRLTESYSKAIEQLASEKIEERLGAIYTLEQISQESKRRYWTVMETLTAFVRERASWDKTAPRVSERAYRIWQEAGCPDGRADEHWREAIKTTAPTEPPTDIAAVLTVICRRDEENRQLEKDMGRRFDLQSTDLRGADLDGGHFENAKLRKVHLEDADLRNTHFTGAHLDDGISKARGSRTRISKTPSSIAYA